MQSCFFAIRPIVVVVVLLYYALLQHRNEYIYWQTNTDLYNYMITYTTTDKTDRYMEYLRFSITREFA